MPTYSWKGKNRMGKMQEGNVAAENKEAVIALLRRQQIMVSAVTEKGKEFLLALALWKIQRLLASPFRFRSGCHLRCATLTSSAADVEIDVDIKTALKAAGFASPEVTEIYWPPDELYRDAQEEPATPADGDEANEDEDQDDNG